LRRSFWRKRRAYPRHDGAAPEDRERRALRNDLQRVTPEKYSESKARLRTLARPARERRSIQRDPQGHLKRLLEAWLDTS